MCSAPRLGSLHSPQGASFAHDECQPALGKQPASHTQPRPQYGEAYPAIILAGTLALDPKERCATLTEPWRVSLRHRELCELCDQEYGPTMLHESVPIATKRVFGSHPRRVSSISYPLTGFFHGRDVVIRMTDWQSVRAVIFQGFPIGFVCQMCARIHGLWRFGRRVPKSRFPALLSGTGC